MEVFVFYGKELLQIGLSYHSIFVAWFKSCEVFHKFALLLAFSLELHLQGFYKGVSGWSQLSPRAKRVLNNRLAFLRRLVFTLTHFYSLFCNCNNKDWWSAINDWLYLPFWDMEYRLSLLWSVAALERLSSSASLSLEKTLALLIISFAWLSKSPALELISDGRLLRLMASLARSMALFNAIFLLIWSTTSS